MLDQSFVSGKTFRDNKNFPHGFSRSGTFSRNESDILSKGGVVANALISGEIVPETEAQHRLLEVCRGESEAVTEFERVWLKYIEAIGTKRSVFSFASTGNLASSEGRVYSRDILG